MKSEDEDFGRTIERKVRQKLAGKHKDRGLAYGLGMFGLVGFSFAVPFVGLTAIGTLIDANTGGRYSWTLMFLVGGLMLGAVNTGYWISRERRKIEEERQAERDRREGGKEDE